MSAHSSVGASPGSVVSVLMHDRALADGIPRHELPAAARASLAAVQWLEYGPWRPDTRCPADRGGIGLLVLEGVLLRRVTVRGAPCAELLGRDDLLRPWSTGVEEMSSVPIRASFSVLAQTRLAVLDRSFAIRMARWPEVTDALIERVTDRTRRLTYNLAAQRSKRVDERLWLLLWQVADRWGVVGPDGVEIRLPGLSHTLLGALIAARRPSVTTAIGRLVERGLLRRGAHGALVLCGEPSPDAVRDSPCAPRPALVVAQLTPRSDQ